MTGEGPSTTAPDPPEPPGPTEPANTFVARLALKHRLGGIAVPAVTVVVAFLMSGSRGTER